MGYVISAVHCNQRLRSQKIDSIVAKVRSSSLEVEYLNVSDCMQLDAKRAIISSPRHLHKYGRWYSSDR